MMKKLINHFLRPQQWKNDQHWKSSTDTGTEGDTRWKSDGASTRNIDTSSWVNDIRGTEQVGFRARGLLMLRVRERGLLIWGDL